MTALSDRIWWTKKSHIQCERRLLAKERHAQYIMLWYSFFSVCGSIYYLKFTDTSNNGDVAWIIFSVLVLLVSGYINGLSLKNRAGLIKDSYEALNGLYHRALHAGESEADVTKEYEQILSICENHEEIDYYRAVVLTYLNHDPESKSALTTKPSKFTYLVFAYYSLKKLIMLSCFYLFPLTILYIIECF